MIGNLTVMKKIQRPTLKENEAINKAIASDPDTFDPKDGFDHLVRVDPKKLGRPVGSGHKSQISIRLDDEVLDEFRKTGPGWQTRINDALKDWLRTHRAA